MAAPDLALICEIMLMSEGFQQSKLLSRKFIILYKLCEDLLSKVGGGLEAGDIGASCGWKEGAGDQLLWGVVGVRKDA